MKFLPIMLFLLFVIIHGQSEQENNQEVNDNNQVEKNNENEETTNNIQNNNENLEIQKQAEKTDKNSDNQQKNGGDNNEEEQKEESRKKFTSSEESNTIPSAEESQKTNNQEESETIQNNEDKLNEEIGSNDDTTTQEQKDKAEKKGQNGKSTNQKKTKKNSKKKKTPEDKPKVDKNSTDEPFNLTYEMIKAFEEYFASSNKTQSEEASIDTEGMDVVADSTDNKTKEEEEDDKERAERREWDEKVSSFSFENLITLKVIKGKSEPLYEDITKPTMISVAFTLNHPDIKIDFSIYGPNTNGKRKTLLDVREKNYFFFELFATEIGTYTFLLKNHRFQDNAKVTFALSTNRTSEEGNLESKSLDSLSMKIQNIDGKMNEMRMKQNMIIKKVEGHNSSVLKHNKSIVVFSIVEVITMILIFFLQTCYIKRLLAKA